MKKFIIICGIILSAGTLFSQDKEVLVNALESTVKITAIHENADGKKEPVANGSAVYIGDLSNTFYGTFPDKPFAYLFVTARHVVDKTNIMIMETVEDLFSVITVANPADITFNIDFYCYNENGKLESTGTIYEEDCIFLIVEHETEDVAIIVALSPEEFCITKSSIVDEEYMKNIHVGQEVFTSSCPLGIPGVLNIGENISKIYAKIWVEDKPYCLHLCQMHVEPGSSGGGVFNEEGNLIGVISMVYNTDHKWLGGFTSVEFLHDLLDDAMRKVALCETE